MPGGSHLAVVDQAKNNMKKLETYISTGMDNTVEIALDLLEHDKDGHNARLTELRRVMLEYARMENRLKNFVDVVDELKGQVKDVRNADDLDTLLDEKLREKEQKCKEQDLRKHDKYIDLEKRIDDMKNTASSNAGPSSPTQIDEDVAMTQQEINTRCPYTGKEMVHPVKNKLCGHNYEREGIDKYIKSRKGKAKCPVPGCISEKPIDASHLEENKDLKRFIENKQRQERKGPKK